MLRFLKPLSLTTHGAIVLIIGFAFLFPSLSLELGGVETEGVVVDFKPDSAGSWSSGGNQPVVVHSTMGINIDKVIHRFPFRQLSALNSLYQPYPFSNRVQRGFVG